MKKPSKLLALLFSLLSLGAAQAQMVRVTVQLNAVHCGNTEDTTGADELYAVSTLAAGDPKTANAAIVGPISINDSQTRNFSGVLFDAVVPAGSTVRGGVQAFDEDFAKDWAKRPEWIEKMKSAAVDQLSASGDPYAAGAGQILNWGYKIFNFFASKDQDDLLGTLEFNIPASGPASETKSWDFYQKGSIGYSTWNYTVGYTITRQVVSGQVNTPTPSSSSAPQYNAVWRMGGGPEVQVYGWTADDLAKKDNEMFTGNMRLSSLQAYTVGGALRYDAVWKPGSEAQRAVYGWTYADYRKLYDTLWPQGWRLKLLNVVNTPDGLRYNAAWKPGTEAEVQVYGWAYADFRKKYDDLWKQNMRLSSLQSYLVGGQVRMNAVWKPGSQAELQVYGWSYADYRKKYDELWPQGWRLHILQPYRLSDGSVRYDAVWRPGSQPELQVYGSSYADFRAEYDKRWIDGWRLSILSVH